MSSPLTSQQGSTPKVSVIIPCFQQAHFVEEAILSVLQQTLPSLEVIVVDDGSLDDVSRVTRQFQDERLRLVRQQNGGVAAARNHGLQLAGGVYVQFLDADDWIAPEKLSRQVTALESAPATGLVYSDYYLVYGTELSTDFTLDDRCFGPREPDFFDSWWIQGVFPLHAALVRRTWIHRAGGFNVHLPPGHADYELWLRLAGMGCRAQVVPGRLAYYRQHDDSMSSDATAMLESIAAARLEVARRFPDRASEATRFALRRLAELRERADARADDLAESVRLIEAQMRILSWS